MMFKLTVYMNPIHTFPAKEVVFNKINLVIQFINIFFLVFCFKAKHAIHNLRKKTRQRDCTYSSDKVLYTIEGGLIINTIVVILHLVLQGYYILTLKLSAIHCKTSIRVFFEQCNEAKNVLRTN